jgi:hypothetical protein
MLCESMDQPQLAEAHRVTVMLGGLTADWRFAIPGRSPARRIGTMLSALNARRHEGRLIPSGRRRTLRVGPVRLIAGCAGSLLVVFEA